MRRILSIATLAALLATATMLGGQASAQSVDVKQAYKREFAFLNAEKNTLEKRIAALEKEAQAKTSAARGEIDRIQGGIMSATLEAERLNEMMYDAERSVEGIEEGSDAVLQTLEQAASTLEKHGVQLPEKQEAEAAEGEAAIEGPPTVDLEQLDFALTKAVGLLEQVNTIRREKGAYFDAEGEKVEGEILRVGNVAAYGIADGAYGALAPAGGGRLKVWTEPQGVQTATALARDQNPGLLGIFFFESLDKGVEKRKEKTALDIVQSGGVIAWVIVGLGCFSLLMMLLRTLLLLRSRANTGRLVEKLEPLLEKDRIDDAIQLCRKSRSAAGRVLRTTLQNLNREREHLEDIISEAILHETPTLDRFGNTILVLAAVAPLMGLLGTVTGMISTFDVITEFGTGNPKLLSGGISEALVTTELGLIVAIPSLLIGNMLSGWADSIKDDMDKAALRVTNVATGIRVSRFTATSMPAPKPAEQAAGA
jgi:biopolymer transport protein ExbB